MDRSFSNQLDVPEDHAAIREGVRAVVTRFDDEYWLARDEDGKFPFEFHRAMADAGWLGITIFYSDLDPSEIEVRRITKMCRQAVDSIAIFIDHLFISEAARIS